MAPCSAKDCPKQATKKGLCSSHYQQHRRGRPLTPLRFCAPTGEQRVCRFSSCGRPATKRGLCPGHYQQEKAGRTLSPLREVAPGRICSGPSCNRVSVCKGLCDGHYQQLRAGKDLRPLQRLQSGCDFPGCVRPHEARGLCYLHYTQATDNKELRESVRAASPVAVVQEEGYARVTLFGTSISGRRGEVVGEAFVSLGDVPIVSLHRWRKNAGGYVGTKVSGRFVSMHRMLMSAPPDLEVDHIDGVRHNNRRENLRLVTKKEQAQNKKVRVESFTGLRSVHFDKKKNLYRVISTTGGVRRGHRHKRLEDAVAEAQALRAAHMTHHNEARSVRADPPESDA